MSPERHQRAVEILETEAGLEYSADVERTREWGDAIAEADDEAAQAPAPSAIVDTELLERRTACGRKPERNHQTTNWDDVTCSECKAAARADEGTR